MLRPQLAVAVDRRLAPSVGKPIDVVVVGGGIAGCAAATVLAERGFRVRLIEAADELGGRARAGHGFHAFFRQYYTLRRLLSRVGGRLRPLPDYPVVSPVWGSTSFARLPHRPPWNLLALLVRSPGLLRLDGRAATPLLSFDPVRTFTELDSTSAAELLDSLRLPARSRALLFDVFAHSFFNREEEMSAAEMVMMFHFYFLANPEGLLFDVPDGDYGSAIWQPWQAYLESLDVAVELGARAESLPEAQAVVVAVDVPSLRRLASGTALEAHVAGLTAAPPYAVLRFRGSVDASRTRPPFAGVSGARALDSVAVEPGGAYELHAYAEPRTTDLASRLRVDLAGIYPETAAMAVHGEELTVRDDASAFPPGSHASRPGVGTSVPGVYLAGDFVKLPFPTALMERAAASGVMAANAICARHGVRGQWLLSVPTRGLLKASGGASRPRRRRGRGTAGR